MVTVIQIVISMLLSNAGSWALSTVILMLLSNAGYEHCLQFTLLLPRFFV